VKKWFEPKILAGDCRACFNLEKFAFEVEIQTTFSARSLSQRELGTRKKRAVKTLSFSLFPQPFV